MYCWLQPVPTMSSSAKSAVNAAGLATHIVDVEAFALENACQLVESPDS